MCLFRLYFTDRFIFIDTWIFILIWVVSTFQNNECDQATFGTFHGEELIDFGKGAHPTQRKYLLKYIQSSRIYPDRISNLRSGDCCKIIFECQPDFPPDLKLQKFFLHRYYGDSDEWEVFKVIFSHSVIKMV